MIIYEPGITTPEYCHFKPKYLIVFVQLRNKMSLPNQVPTAPETRSATLVSQDEAQDEGLWMRKSGHKKDPSGK